MAHSLGCSPGPPVLATAWSHVHLDQRVVKQSKDRSRAGARNKEPRKVEGSDLGTKNLFNNCLWHQVHYGPIIFTHTHVLKWLMYFILNGNTKPQFGQILNWQFFCYRDLYIRHHVTFCGSNSPSGYLKPVVELKFDIVLAQNELRILSLLALTSMISMKKYKKSASLLVWLK